MTELPVATRRRPEGVEVRPLGWWGTLLLAMVLATTYAAMYFTYVYVRVASVEWPPPGIDPPALGLPSLSALALAASAVTVWWAARREVARALASYRAGLLATGALAGAHFVLLLADWSRQPFAVDSHAYGSLYYVLPGLHLVIVGIGLLMVFVLFALSWHQEQAMVHVGTRSMALYWYVSVAGGLVLIAVVYLVPHVWREAIVP